MAQDRIVHSVGEIEQDRIGAEILDRVRIQRVDRRKGLIAELACPEIISAHLHPPLVLPHRAGRGEVEIFIVFAIVKFERVEIEGIGQGIHCGIARIAEPVGSEIPVMRAEFAAKPVHRRYRPRIH